jgi:hypothetical protein
VIYDSFSPNSSVFNVSDQVRARSPLDGRAFELAVSYTVPCQPSNSSMSRAEQSP